MMSTLSKLPAEILEIIFQECLADSWDALEKTPSLIAALRARDELKMYFQALEIFNKTNEYDLGGHNFHLFKTMPDTVLSTIRQLSITIDELNHPDQEISEVYKYFRSFRDLTKLTIYVFGECWDDWEDYSYDKPLVERMLCGFLEAIIPQCPDLRALVLGRFLSALLGAGRQLSHLDKLAPHITFNVHTIEEVNYRLGMEATNRRASAGPGNVQWQWIAKEGEPLTWKKRERRISQE